MDASLFNLMVFVFLFIIVPTFLMVMITSRKINSVLGYLGIFIILSVDPFSPLGQNIMPSWFAIIGILLIGIFFWQFIHNRRSG